MMNRQLLQKWNSVCSSEADKIHVYEYPEKLVISECAKKFLFGDSNTDFVV